MGGEGRIVERHLFPQPLTLVRGNSGSYRPLELSEVGGTVGNDSLQDAPLGGGLQKDLCEIISYRGSPWGALERPVGARIPSHKS